MTFDLIIHEGFSALKIGQLRSEVGAMLIGHDLTVHAREPNTDFFTDIGLIASYDQENTLEYIEISFPSKACLCKSNLLGLTRDEALNIIKTLIDEEPVLEFGSFIYRGERLAFKVFEGLVESVSVFKFGYL